MYERFTEASRKVVVTAQDEARAMGHDYIGTEHLLLGIIQNADSASRAALDDFGVTVDKARKAILAVVDPGDVDPSAPLKQVPFTPRAKKLLELGLREALRLHDNTIQPYHLLLAVTRDSGVAARALQDFNADATSIRSAVLTHLGLNPAQSDGRIDVADRIATSTFDEIHERLIHGLGRSANPYLTEALERMAALAQLSLPGYQKTRTAMLEKRSAKEAALEDQRFEDAAALRLEERELNNQLKEITARPLHELGS